MADPGPLGSASVVVFGLASAAAWGSADFGGGLASRRAPLFGVVLLSQVGGMAFAFGLALLRREPAPGPLDVGWSLLAGVLGAVGILGLYGGLAVGRMSVVAPVTGVLAAIVPVMAGVILEGVPHALVMLGIALALAAVVLVSRLPGEAGGRSGIELAIASGLALGLFNVVISRVDDRLVFGPLTVVRAAEAATVVLVVLATRRPVRLPAALAPAVVGIGLFDMAGNAGFLFAQQSGPLAVASILSSLYPVTTLLLAALVLHERLTRTHAVGIAAALGGIVLIGMGSMPGG